MRMVLISWINTWALNVVWLSVGVLNRLEGYVLNRYRYVEDTRA